jgi:2C-methyl-D-erythritol 2,4-cyclodiphosphate synthase
MPGSLLTPASITSVAAMLLSAILGSTGLGDMHAFFTKTSMAISADQPDTTEWVESFHFRVSACQSKLLCHV